MQTLKYVFFGRLIYTAWNYLFVCSWILLFKLFPYRKRLNITLWLLIAMWRTVLSNLFLIRIHSLLQSSEEKYRFLRATALFHSISENCQHEWTCSVSLQHLGSWIPFFIASFISSWCILYSLSLFWDNSATLSLYLLVVRNIVSLAESESALSE